MTPIDSASPYTTAGRSFEPADGSTNAGGTQLPEPDGAGASLDDEMTALYVALSALRRTDSTAGEQCVAQNRSSSEEARSEEVAATTRARANQADSGGGLFASVGKLLGDVAGDLIHVRIGAAFEDAAEDLAGAWNSPHLWSDLVAGLEDVSHASEGVAAVAAVLGPAGAAIEAAASIAGAVATGSVGLAEARVSHFAAAAEDAEADATSARNHIGELETAAEQLLSNLKDTDHSHEQALESLGDAIAIHDETLVTAASLRLKA